MQSLNAFCAKAKIKHPQFSPRILLLCSLCEEFWKSDLSIEKCLLVTVKTNCKSTKGRSVVMVPMFPIISSFVILESNPSFLLSLRRPSVHPSPPHLHLCVCAMPQVCGCVSAVCGCICVWCGGCVFLYVWCVFVVWWLCVCVSMVCVCECVCGVCVL